MENRRDGYKKKMCSKGKNCVAENCVYAHNYDELIPVICNYGNNCRYKDTTCAYFHPDTDDTKEKYISRRKDYVNKINHVREKERETVILTIESEIKSVDDELVIESLKTICKELGLTVTYKRENINRPY